MNSLQQNCRGRDWSRTSQDTDGNSSRIPGVPEVGNDSRQQQRLEIKPRNTNTVNPLSTIHVPTHWILCPEFWGTLQSNTEIPLILVLLFIWPILSTTKYSPIYYYHMLWNPLQTFSYTTHHAHPLIFLHTRNKSLSTLSTQCLHHVYSWTSLCLHYVFATLVPADEHNPRLLSNSPESSSSGVKKIYAFL